MELRHLHYFIAIAEARNFSRAAEQLHMAQPPLSQQIRDLETELGVQLFDRSKRPLEITLAGQTFLAEARLAVAQVEQAKQLTQRVQRGEVGCLTVGFTSSIANSVLPDILREFRHQFPKVELVWRELATHSQIQGLRDRQIDIAFCHLPSEALKYKDMDFMTILEEPLIIALPETHPLSIESEISLAVLAQEAFVLPTREFVSGLSEQIYYLCHQAGFVPKGTQEATFMLTILGLVAGGVGVALLPANAQNLQRKGVIYRKIQGQTATVQITAAWRRQDHSIALKNFREVTKLVLQSEKYSPNF